MQLFLFSAPLAGSTCHPVPAVRLAAEGAVGAVKRKEYAMELNVSVRNRRARCDPGCAVVCGNTGDTVRFDFDSEWDAFAEKIAHFVYTAGSGVQRIEVPFSGDHCAVPRISGTDLLEIGVSAGAVRTTASARIPCLASVTELIGEPDIPVMDVYHSAMQMLAAACGGFAGRYLLLAAADSSLIAASDGS